MWPCTSACSAPLQLCCGIGDRQEWSETRAAADGACLFRLPPQPGTVAEAVAAARADARRELDRLEQLLAQVGTGRLLGGAGHLAAFEGSN